jgi:hypothetical protein
MSPPPAVLPPPVPPQLTVMGGGRGIAGGADFERSSSFLLYQYQGRTESIRFFFLDEEKPVDIAFSNLRLAGLLCRLCLEYSSVFRPIRGNDFAHL